MTCCKDLAIALIGVAIGIYVANLLQTVPWITDPSAVLPFVLVSAATGAVAAPRTTGVPNEDAAQRVQLDASGTTAPSPPMLAKNEAVGASAIPGRHEAGEHIKILPPSTASLTSTSSATVASTTTPPPPSTTAAAGGPAAVPEAWRNVSFRMPADLEHCPGIAAWVHSTVRVQFEPWQTTGVTSKMSQASHGPPNSNACCYPMTVRRGQITGPGKDSTWAGYMKRAIKSWPYAREELRDFDVSQTYCDWPNLWKGDPRTHPSKMAPMFGNANNGNFREILMPVQIRPQYDENFLKNRAEALRLGKKPWKKRKDVAVWKGNIGCTIGCGPRGRAFFPSNHIEHCVEDTNPGSNADDIGFSYGCAEERSGPKSGAWMRHPRAQLVNLSATRGQECGIDATFPDLGGAHRPFMHKYKVDVEAWTRGKYMNDDETSTHRYVFHVLNNGYADRSWRMFALGCVVLLVDVDGWQEFFWSFLEPYVHYIPVKGDMSDACEQLAWARANPEKAEAIANRGRAFVEDCMPVGMINLYTAEVMRQYGQLWAKGHKRS